ncbi:serine protease [Pseudonocardiaceae bacterium YIM PH 21723]|nr:serine protease [Pseudonocardiaceae bacterium YIM PH 21723]
MRLRIAAIAMAALASLAAAPAATARVAATPTLEGTVALNNCSAAVVRLTTLGDNDPAILQTNGHCLETGFPSPGQVITNQASSRTGQLLNAGGTSVGTVRATKVLYSTMTGTDVTWYQLNQSYAEVAKLGVKILELAGSHPTAGSDITVASGYWKRLYTCNIDGFVYQLKEGGWTNTDSIRYTSACKTIGGTSGSPIIEHSTGKVIGINNTGNESGERCTENNPCEVDQSGNVTVRKGINYGQQTYQLYGCMDAGTKLNLNKPGCALPKP